jgi:NADPH-dependent 2,4-dienoyl-CoA reductase/sulfur reductase-like enzyme
MLLQALSVVILLGLCALLLLAPNAGLFLFWRLLAPLIPISMALMPELWWTISPVNVIGMLPQRLGIGGKMPMPPLLQRHGILIGIGLFLLTIPSRDISLDIDATALARLILGVLALVLLESVVFKRPDGCSNFYPLLPLQRILAPHLYNTYSDPHQRSYNLFFACAFPGLVLAYYLIPTPASVDAIPIYYAQFAVYLLASLGSFVTLSTFVEAPTNRLATLYTGIGLGLYYWFTVPRFVDDMKALAGVELTNLVDWLTIVAALAGTIFWIVRTNRQDGTPPATDDPQPPYTPEPPRSAPEPQAQPKVYARGSLIPEARQVTAAPASSFLKLGMPGARPQDPLALSLTLAPPTIHDIGRAPRTRSKTSAPRVVIVGNGVVGMTAAQSIHQYHTASRFRVLGRSNQPTPRRAMAQQQAEPLTADGRVMQPDLTRGQESIVGQVNAGVVAIDRGSRHVILGSGEEVPYDQLILATGSIRKAPSIAGFGMPGTFLLRETDDPARQAFLREQPGRHAIIGDGGALGLEACNVLRKHGYYIGILTSGSRLLPQYLDPRSSELLCNYLETNGVEVVFRVGIAAVGGTNRVRQVMLAGGQTLPCDMFLIHPERTPDVTLARNAGLRVHKGIVVDDSMRTSAPDILAAGDVTEHRGQVYGPWPAPIEQAHIAAMNAMGGNLQYRGAIPFISLNVVGLEVTSIGRIEPRSEDEIVITHHDSQKHWYRKLIIERGNIVGAILLGHPLDVSKVRSAIKQQVDVRACMDELRAGKWGTLRNLI